MTDIYRVLIMLMAFALSACGYNVKAIKTFEAGTSSLADSYSKMVNQTGEWCYKNHLNVLLTSPDYSYKTIHDDLDNLCKKFVEDNQRALISASIVNGYAQALAMVAGVTPQYLNDDLAKIGDIAQQIKDGEGSPRLTEDEATKSVKLAKYLSELYISYKVKKETVSIIQQNKDLVNKHVQIMSGYANDLYDAEAEFYKASRERVVRAFEPVVTLKPGQVEGDVAPHRFLMYEFSRRESESKARETTIKKFDNAANALIDANNDLEQRFATLPKDEQLKSVVAFARKSQKLRDELMKSNK